MTLKTGEDTFGYTGSSEPVDVSDVDEIYVELTGAGGGDGGSSTGGDGGIGGDGGYIEAWIDVSGISSLDVYVGEGGSSTSTASTWGYHDGGGGGESDSIPDDGGSGAGSTALVDGAVELLSAHGGGGGGSASSSSAHGGGGGGGGAGGSGGSAFGGDATAGDGGEGTGEGGDGGDAGDLDQGGDDGGPGGQRVESALVYDVVNEETGGGSSGDGEVFVEYYVNVEPPANLAVVGHDATSISLEWDAGENVDGHRVYRDTEPGVDPATATEVADLDDPNADEYTDTGLDNGTEYHYVVTGYYDDFDEEEQETDPTNEVSETTDLPDVDTFALEADEPNEIFVHAIESDVNTGRYRIRWQRASGGSWDDATIDYDVDPLEYTIDGLLGGEPYAVEVRTETDDVDGEWLADDATTVLGAVENLAVTPDLFDALVEWDVVYPFDGDLEVWAGRTDYDFGDDPGELVATLDDDAESHDLEDLQPGREYDLTVRAVTDHAETDASLTFDAAALGVELRAIPATGWYVEVDHPSGRTLRPVVTADAQRRPTVNGLPTIDIPTQFDGAWQDDALDDAAMRVWHDAQRQPIDRLEHRDLAAGDGRRRTQLQGKGGTQLERHVEEDVTTELTHEFAAYLIGEYTDYTADVDDPDTGDTDIHLQAAETFAEFQTALEEIPDDIPLEYDGDTIKRKQSCFVRDVTDYDFHDGDSFQTTNEDDYTGGTGRGFRGNAAEYEYEFEIDHRIPEGEFEILYRNEGVFGQTENIGNLVWSVDGVEVAQTNTLLSLGWNEVFADAMPGTGTDAPELEPGTHTVTVEIDDDPNWEGSRWIDLLAFRDGRFGKGVSELDNEVHEPQGHLNDPQEFGGAAPIETQPVTTPISINEVSVEASTIGGHPLAEIGIGIDGTGDFDTVADTLTHSLAYVDPSTTARARFGIGADQTVERDDATPRTGFEPVALDGFDMTANLDDTPVITDRSFDDRLVDILNDIAEFGNFVWGVEQSGDDTVVRWTRIDQREATVDPDVASYQIDRQTEDVIERAIISGGAQTVTRIPVTIAIGEWVDIGVDGRIVDGRETVWDGDTEYTRGDDYEIRYSTAEIRGLEDGALDDEQEVRIDADVKPQAEYVLPDHPDVDEARTISQDIPGLASTQMCEQVALYLVDRFGEPIVEGEVTVPHDAVEWSVVEAIDADQLPGDGPFQVFDVDADADRTRIQLGSGQTAQEAVRQIQSTLGSTTERV